MARIRKSSMREQCYMVLKEKILKQEYDLGDDINIVAFSNDYSVSNTPIREALALLQADGIVTSSLNSKVRVITFDENSFHEMTQTISILLTGAYLQCVKEKKSKLLIQLMEQSLKKQRTRLSEKDYYNFIHEAINFDKCILDALGNTRLLDVFASISNILFLMTRTDHQKNEHQREINIQEHTQILEALKNNNNDEFLKLLEHHYDKSLGLP